MKPLHILVRHLPTTEDAQGLYSDPSVEVPLLPVDEARLVQLGRSLAAVRQVRNSRPLEVYCSPVARSTATVERVLDVSGLTAPVHHDRRLDNIIHPKWNGLSRFDVQDTELYRVWHSQPSMAKFPDGESIQDVNNRIEDFLNSLSGRRDTLIVSHSTPLQVLCCRLLDLPMDAIWSFYFETYSLTAILERTLVRFNSVSVEPINEAALHE